MDRNISHAQTYAEERAWRLGMAGSLKEKIKTVIFGIHKLKDEKAIFIKFLFENFCAEKFRGGTLGRRFLNECFCVVKA